MPDQLQLVKKEFLHLTEDSDTNYELQETLTLRTMQLKVIHTLHFVSTPNDKSFWTTFVAKLMNNVKLMSLPISPFRF